MLRERTQQRGRRDDIRAGRRDGAIRGEGPLALVGVSAALYGRIMAREASRPRRSLRAALGVLTAMSLLVACSSDEAASDEVVLYTSMPDAVVSQLEGVIEQRFPDLDGNFWAPGSRGITLRVVRGRTADIQQRIADELASGGMQADLIWLAEPSPYEAYEAMGLLAPYEPPPGAPIPETYIDPEGFYVAGRVISMVLAWNTARLPAGLVDWTDLQGVPRAAFPAPESGAARATIQALTDEYGAGFFTALAAAGASSVPSNGAARDGITAGTYDAAAVLDYMARDAKASGAAIDFVYPDSGTVLIPSPIVITAQANNPAAAAAFVDFILSEPGQKIMVQIGNFYPVRSDVAPPTGAPPLDTIATLDVDWETLGSDVEAIRTMWDEVFGAGAGSS